MIIHVDDEKNFLYVEIPKAACTTIKHALFIKKYLVDCPLDVDLELMHTALGYQQVTNLEPYKDYFKFTVVRDPYKRFMSVYFTRIQNRRDPVLFHSLGITDWSDEVLNEPNNFIHEVNKDILNRNPHTALQTNLLPENLNELDYLGQLENMAAVEKKLSQRLDENIRFERLNEGRKIDYHSINIDADRFNDIFADDYEKLKDFYEPLKKISF